MHCTHFWWPPRRPDSAEPLHDIAQPDRRTTGHRVASGANGRMGVQHAPRPAVFSPILATFTNPDRATEQDLLQGFSVSVDLDSHPRQSLDRLEAILGPATVIIQTGGAWANGDGTAEDKLQAHWRIRQPAEKENLAKLKRARELAARLAGCTANGGVADRTRPRRRSGRRGSVRYRDRKADVICSA